MLATPNCWKGATQIILKSGKPCVVGQLNSGEVLLLPMVVEIVLCVARCLALNHAYAEFWRSGHCASPVTKCMVVNNDPSGETGRHWFIVFLETLPAEGRGVDASPCSQSMSPMQPNTAANKKDRSPNHQGNNLHQQPSTKKPTCHRSLFESF